MKERMEGENFFFFFFVGGGGGALWAKTSRN